MWTDERVELLKKYWADGWSASQVARMLGSVTRNAVIGKIHRLDLPTRLTRISNTYGRPRGYYPSRPAKKRTRQVMVDIPAPLNIPLGSIQTGECRWPVQDPWEPPFNCCGCHVEPGEVYCAAHVHMSHRGAPESSHAIERLSDWASKREST